MVVGLEPLVLRILQSPKQMYTVAGKRLNLACERTTQTRAKIKLATVRASMLVWEMATMIWSSNDWTMKTT